jgi:hypothetical protein
MTQQKCHRAHMCIHGYVHACMHIHTYHVHMHIHPHHRVLSAQFSLEIALEGPNRNVTALSALVDCCTHFGKEQVKSLVLHIYVCVCVCVCVCVFTNVCEYICTRSLYAVFICKHSVRASVRVYIIRNFHG